MSNAEHSRPKCQVRWIDCAGNPTPDDNPAVGFAVLRSDGRRFLVCADHAALLSAGRVHHQHDCRHVARDPMSALWTFEALR